jgi:tetratricopeptide (TPR) repeat protein
VILEKDQRLSGSMLWKIQRSFFDAEGVRGWREGTIPQYITTNAFIARAYARVALGWLRDCQAAGLDPDQPIYIIELGSGSGRFAHGFLKYLFAWLDALWPGRLQVRYVLTDFTDSNISYWRSHPSFEPWLQAGRLDFASFDAARDNQIVLSRSGDVLAPGAVKNPLMAIANYVLDTLPQDAFTVHGGKLFESVITVASTQEEPDLLAPGLLERIQVSHSDRPLEGDYYAEPVFNHILAGYRERLGHASLLFPVAALTCLANLERIAGGRVLFLAGDKGYHSASHIIEVGDPGYVVHGGCFSMMVSFHTLGQYVLDRGGLFLSTAHQHNSLDVCAFLLGPGGYPETRLAYEDSIERGGPDDFFLMKRALGKAGEKLTVEEILGCLRLSGWDPDTLVGHAPRLLEALHDGEPGLHQDVLWAVRQAWDMYYPIGERPDLAFAAGLLLNTIRYYPEARRYLTWSLERYGPDADTLFNLALCHHNLRDLPAALACVKRALDLEPNFEEARDLRIRIEAELALEARPATA